MIIDSHTHFGSSGLFQLSCKTLLRQMELWGVEQALISTVACCECAPYTQALLERQTPQLEANRRLLEAAAASGGRLYVSFWCKPATETAAGVYDFIREHRALVRGLKFHPYYSALALDDRRYLPYFEIAAQLNLPVSVHTGVDAGLSAPDKLAALAKRFPTVPVIAVHMGLGTDHEAFIRHIRKRDNLYGDTTWVPPERVRRAMAICGSEKILFGSDAPIDGDSSYRFYQTLLEGYRRAPDDAWDNVMYKNARTLFGLPKRPTLS